jgi:hypothetical protein
MFNREKAIEELINNDINMIRDQSEWNDFSYLESVLEFGFTGYFNMTDEQLIQELNDRDISELFGDNDD